MFINNKRRGRREVKSGTNFVHFLSYVVMINTAKLVSRLNRPTDGSIFQKSSGEEGYNTSGI